MSNAGLREATKHALGLRRFESLTEAQAALFAERDSILADVLAKSRASTDFEADFTPRSLVDLERWYFQLADDKLFQKLNIDQGEFERGISFYLGEVLVRHGRGFAWFVEENWLDPSRYNIGVRRPQFALMLDEGRSLSRRNNARMQSLLREFKRHAP